MTVLFQEIMGGIASIFENISPKLNGPIIVKKKSKKSLLDNKIDGGGRRSTPNF